jgi:hypothetical protein
MKSKSIFTLAAAASVATLIGCAPLSQPVTQREQAAGVGALTGGAAGYYFGDQLANNGRSVQAQLDERDAEIQQLRRDIERLKNER